MKTAFAGKQVGAELAEQQKDDSRMNHPDARFVAAEAEALEMRSDKVDQQDPTDQVAARENRESSRSAAFGPQ